MLESLAIERFIVKFMSSYRYRVVFPESSKNVKFTLKTDHEKCSQKGKNSLLKRYAVSCPNQNIATVAFDFKK